MQVAVWSVIGLATGTVCLLAAALALQRNLLFPAPKRQAFLDAPHHHVRRLRIPVCGGCLEGYLASPLEGRSCTRGVLYFHGRRENPTSIYRGLRELQGMHVACFRYRQQGWQWRKPAETTLVNDGLDVLAWMASHLGVHSDAIALVGRSLGAAIAVQVAARSRSRCLVLVSPFDSLLHVLQRPLPWVRAWMLKDHYQTQDHIAKVSCPVLIIVGNNDRAVPPAMSLKLLALCHSTAALHEVAAGGHRGLMRQAQVHHAIGSFCTA
jgi:pimeloyl-ACP methyl ester carboxylesterase